MNIFMWTVLVVAGISVPFLLLLIILGSPSPQEPGILKALRYNIWAEYLALVGHALLHPRLLSYRATGAEKKMRMPGDGLVPAANAGATYAATIDAPAERIWPWLVQMGSGRALWYCWSPFHEYPEFKSHISPYSIHPEWQNLKVGDILLDGDALNQCSENRGAWRVMEMQDQSAVVFFSARDFVEGFEFDPQTTRPEKFYGITSWVFYILPSHEKQSRLIIRVRVEIGPPVFKAVARIFFGLGDAVFERTILDGIKYRVEHCGEEYLNPGRETDCSNLIDNQIYYN